MAGPDRHLARANMLLAVAAAGEAATGLALIVAPSMVVALLFGAGVDGTGAVMSRIAGLALIGLGLACWPRGASAPVSRPAIAGMLAYSGLATVYLGIVGLDGQSGSLLWPAVAVHTGLTALLAVTWARVRQDV
jgi:hypothetical protein